MQNSIYKIKYLLFLSWDREAWCLTVWEGNTPPPERNTAWNKGRKCFHCLGAPNNLIRLWSRVLPTCKRVSFHSQPGIWFFNTSDFKIARCLWVQTSQTFVIKQIGVLVTSNFDETDKDTFFQSKSIHSFIQYSVWRQAQSLFQSQLST